MFRKLKMIFGVMFLIAQAQAASMWRHHNMASKLKGELMQHCTMLHNNPSMFDSMQDQVETMKVKMADMSGKVYDPSKNEIHKWTEKDKSEVGKNVKICDLLLESDIIPSPKMLHTVSGRGRVKRKVINTDWYGKFALWESTIPYSVDESVDTEKRSTIDQAINFWQRNTCINFVEDSSAEDRISFFVGMGCYSYIGRIGGTQPISLGEGCNFGISVHEIGHALGLIHEQSRMARDDNVTINIDNVEAAGVSNFEIYTSEYSVDLEIPYDLGSIMHYGPWAFSTDWYTETIISKDERYQDTMGQRITLSFLDITAINAAYNCAASCPNVVQCQRMGIVNSRTCQDCICPGGFAGSVCERIEPSQGDCGGTLEASSEWNFISFETASVVRCIYHLVASEGSLVEAQTVEDEFFLPCVDSGCADGFLEVKFLADFRVTGARSCCYASTEPYISQTLLMIVIVETVIPTSTNFTLWYREVVKDECGTGSTWGSWSDFTNCRGPRCGGCRKRTRSRECLFDVGSECDCIGESVKEQICSGTRLCKRGRIDRKKRNLRCCQPYVQKNRRCELSDISDIAQDVEGDRTPVSIVEPKLPGKSNNAWFSFLINLHSIGNDVNVVQPDDT